MDVSAIAKIRDTRGLTTNEKMFLFTVASHRDGMFKTHEKNYTDMSMSKATYYRVRGDLMDKKLIEVQRRMDDSTVYTINKDELDAWCLSHVETAKSLSETRKSLCETPESHCAETKDNLKDNLTNNLQDNLDGSATATPLPKNKDELHAPAARPDDFLIGLDREDALMEQRTASRESHTETFESGWIQPPSDEEVERWIAQKIAEKEARLS